MGIIDTMLGYPALDEETMRGLDFPTPPLRYCTKCGEETTLRITGQHGGYDEFSGKPWYRLTTTYKCSVHGCQWHYVMTTHDADNQWETPFMGRG